MNDLFDSEMSDFVNAAISDNENPSAFTSSQEAIKDWNVLIGASDLQWKEDILNAPCESVLILE